MDLVPAVIEAIQQARFSNMDTTETLVALSCGYWFCLPYTYGREFESVQHYIGLGI